MTVLGLFLDFPYTFFLAESHAHYSP
jgi:hypothetical protein